jgi:hypothetical protein
MIKITKATIDFRKEEVKQKIHIVKTAINNLEKALKKLYEELEK